MKATLVWNGPAGAGAFPTDPTELRDMFEPGVYLRVKLYERGRTVSYVGQSKSVLTRIDQHLTQLLGLQHALRDPAGDVWMRGGFDDRLQCYRDIATASRMAAEEASRMRFFWAHCDETFHVEHLSVAEAALKARLENLARAGIGLTANENQQGISVGALDEPVAIDNDFSGLAADHRALLTSLLGDAPIAVEQDDMAQVFDV